MLGHSGHFKETILKAARTNQTDLLILGASETMDWKDHHFRVLSNAVAEEPGCAVMVVK